MRKWKLLRAGLIAVLAGIPWLACSKQQETAAPPPKPPEATVSKVVERPVTDYAEFTGRMESPANVEIRARVRGYLQAVHFKDGDEVKAGTLLFEIDPRTFQAELQNAEGMKAQWLAKREKAKADVARYEGLVPSGAASAQDLDKARAELGEAIAAISSSDAAIERARLDLEFSRITAPIDGQLSRAMVTKGNLIQGGSGDDALLTTLISLDPMYVYFDVDERTVLEFRERYRQRNKGNSPPESVSDFKMPVLLCLANEDGFPHSGLIDFADNRVDTVTGTVQLRGTFDNSKRVFKPGMFARVRVPVSQEYPAILVAEQAIGTDQGKKYVLVVNDQNVVERRFVKPGPLQEGALRVIADGLKPGESIVVNGLQRARPGKPITPQRAEMPVLGVIGSASTSATSQPKAQTP